MTSSEAPLDLLVVDAPVERQADYRSALHDVVGEIRFVGAGQEIGSIARGRGVAAVLVHLAGVDAAGFDPARLSPLLESAPGVPVVLVSADVSAALAVLPRLFERFSNPLDTLAWPIVPAFLRQKVRLFSELARTGEVAAALAAERDRLAAALEAETHRAEAMAALAAEHVHRGKNLLAIMQSISIRTLSDGRAIAEARSALTGRLRAIARAYHLITASGRAGVALIDIVEGELGEAADRVHVSGPPVRLKGAMVQTFSLAVHELVVNSQAYGALGVPSGSVSVGWTYFECGEDSYLDVEWRERGGPAPAPPLRQGFGLSLLRTLAGSGAPLPNVRFETPGLVCRLRLPQDTLVA